MEQGVTGLGQGGDSILCINYRELILRLLGFNHNRGKSDELMDERGDKGIKVSHAKRRKSSSSPWIWK